MQINKLGRYHQVGGREILMPNDKLCQLFMLIIAAGCTLQPGKDHVADNVNAAGADVQCRSERQTGSSISKTVCTTKAERDAEQAAAADIQRANAAGGAGCRANTTAQGCQ
jgi:hypothetical protein